MKTRLTLALSFAVGLALAGCGPEAANDTPAPVGDPNPMPAGTTQEELSKATAEGVDGPAPSELPNDLKDAEKPGGSEMPAGYPKGGPEMKGETPAPAADPAAGETPKTAEATLTPEEVEAIKLLADDADVKLAMAQMVCPVGEEDGQQNHLGSMGKPVKEEANGKTVFLCCKGCVEGFKADPEKYLAKLPK